MDSEEGEESQFFDALEHVAQEPDVASSNSSPSEKWKYAPWRGINHSVRERRRRFVRWMSSPDIGEIETSMNDDHDSVDGGSLFINDIYRIMEDNGAVLRTSGVGDGLSSCSSWNTDDLDMAHRVASNDMNRSSSCGDEFRMMQNNDSVGDVWATPLANLQSSPSLKLTKWENECSTNTPKKLNRWLRRVRSLNCLMIVDVEDKRDDLGLHCLSPANGKKTRKLKVHQCRRKFKELSGLFIVQDIQAHEGSISAMKFSLDGRYLASGGEDKTVRIWQVVEEETSRTIEVPRSDSSCLYLSMNHLSELAPCKGEKAGANKSTGLRKIPDSACIVFPHKVFRISEELLHVFHGHDGEILDVSWSKNNCLLSSSVDKTVRLWKVGVDHCLKVFHHTDYVTCIQFNPVKDDYFISGSIDGKVRMWNIGGSQVIDWTETRDIVTALSFRPDAKGGIIGCITGTCHVFNVSDNHFQMEGRLYLAGKKKSPCKRIIGFQFLPHDPRKVLVTSADSQLRIVDGHNVIEKYKGLRNGGNQVSASFTSCGKHIVSASEDSHIYVWKHHGDADSSYSQPKLIRSFECFSVDASVAITWPGLESTPRNSLPFLSSTGISSSHHSPLDANPKGSSATWPEEKLSMSIPQALTSSMSKPEYRLFRTCCHSSFSSHAWGLVIVTAGSDGRIRSFHNYGLPIPL